MSDDYECPDPKRIFEGKINIGCYKSAKRMEFHSIRESGIYSEKSIGDNIADISNFRSQSDKLTKSVQEAKKNSLSTLPYPLSQCQIYPLKPCPFCEKTPNINMTISDKTWLPCVKCENVNCVIKPQGPYFAIRKAQKFDVVIIRRKVCHAINAWNDNTPGAAFEGRMVDWDDILAKSKKCHKART